jgi:hypothetical protein
MRLPLRAVVEVEEEEKGRVVSKRALLESAVLKDKAWSQLISGWLRWPVGKSQLSGC